MTSQGYSLYWEDITERLVFAELDDYAWKLPEKLFSYQKLNSIYIYHHGRLAAYYSTKDSRKEAVNGRQFYQNPKNVKNVIELKKNIFLETERHQKLVTNLNINQLTNHELLNQILVALDLYQRSLGVHYLTQPQFFENFGPKEIHKHQKSLMRLAKCRFKYSRNAWTGALKMAQIFLKEYAKRNKITLPQTESLRYQEIERGKVNKKVLSERVKRFALTSFRHRIKIYSGRDVQKYVDKFERYDGINSIHGTVGHPGFVSGKAFVVSNDNLDLSKLPKGMKKGMVLIVQNAWPEFSHYYHLASAIVTNEGGITSHGVVVSRELGIPSIVGTKIATKVFKVGDLVEVDADKGIVRKVRKL